MRRRDVLRAGTAAWAAGVLGLPAEGGRAQAASVPVDDLRRALGAVAEIVTPGSARYRELLPAYNLRRVVKPEARVLPRSAEGVAAAIRWAAERKVPFAVRGGGHSYEGFSQSASLVIDLRLLGRVEVAGGSRGARMLRAGGGATLGAAYDAAAAHGLSLPGGSCPSVGIAGNVLGGGYGFLARAHGLALDALQAVEMVDAGGRIITAGAGENADLCWACRGGGGGSFGIVTRFDLLARPIDRVATFTIGWELPLERAVGLWAAWQDWAPSAPDAITSILRVQSGGPQVRLRCIGQSIGGAAALRSEIARLTREAAASSGPDVRTGSFADAVARFRAPGDPIGMQGRSDYVRKPMGRDGIRTLLSGVRDFSPGGVTVIADAYGGAIGRVAIDATAFPHRAGTLYCMQYYLPLPPDAGLGGRQVAALDRLYAALRPHVSGGAYVNYPDLSLDGWERRYWGGNLERLKAIKRTVDPANLFRHAQSVPL